MAGWYYPAMFCAILTGAITGVLSVVGVIALLAGHPWFGILCLVAAYLTHTDK